MRRAGADARRAGARGAPRWRCVAALAAIGTAAAMWVLVSGGHSHLRLESLASHPAHALASSLGSEFTVSAVHPHLSSGSPTGHHHEAFAIGVLPDSPAAAVAALGVVLAVAGVAVWLAPRVVLAGRGPPSAPATALTGQDLLTRLGLSRR
ncbi:putative copper homeostasis (lipo)protein LpqS [Mycobacterium intracellulare]